ncbi:hypothetical protein EUTSA_v10009575mg [Eutrema salsugineum]|uniref:DUF1985 domain-containing protein n=1 Tax=Eutrema salsugineum TaxID=72664 RepID=V4K812_EUTSA|nr:hypothetical protein EUTSA_v10009575mg [Eutrema salsugineum]
MKRHRFIEKDRLSGLGKTASRIPLLNRLGKTVARIPLRNRLRKTVARILSQSIHFEDGFDHPHRDVEKFHKVQAMWSLILRCVDLKKKKKNELWLFVNGIPICYLITEHALIKGLDCTALPDDYRNKKPVDNTFVSRIFRRKTKISLSAVSKKLQSMEESADGDKLKLGVLYFLASLSLQRRRLLRLIRS